MLTVENVNKHFPESEETVKRHMNRQQQGVRFTKPKDFEELSASSEIEKKKRDVYLKVVDWKGSQFSYLFYVTPATKVLEASRISLTVRLVAHGGGCLRWADTSDQYLNLLFRGFAISFGQDTLVSSLTIQS